MSAVVKYGLEKVTIGFDFTVTGDDQQTVELVQNLVNTVTPFTLGDKPAPLLHLVNQLKGHGVHLITYHGPNETKESGKVITTNL